MFEIVYKRRIANVVDLRIFNSTLEFENWLRWQMEPIEIMDVRKLKEES